MNGILDIFKREWKWIKRDKVKHFYSHVWGSVEHILAKNGDPATTSHMNPIASSALKILPLGRHGLYPLRDISTDLNSP